MLLEEVRSCDRR